jgi:hypothetical protein
MGPLKGDEYMIRLTFVLALFFVWAVAFTTAVVLTVWPPEAAPAALSDSSPATATREAGALPFPRG